MTKNQNTERRNKLAAEMSARMNLGEAERKELERAADRVGQSLEDCIRWLLRFYGDDPIDLSAGDLMNRAFEILWFVRYRPEGDSTTLSFLSFEPKLLLHPSMLSLPSREELIELHASVGKVVDAVLAQQIHYFEFPSFRLYLNPVGLAVGLPWQLVPTFEDKLHVFQFVLMHTVRPYARNIRRCPECLTLFLIDRPNQEYCSVKCQSRVATRRYRETHGLVKSRKRGRPPKPKGGKHGGRKL